MPNFKKETIAINNILLDVENPRFASYFERYGNKNPTQKDAMDYLLIYASIDNLATSIKNSEGLYPTEQIACVIEDGKYIVLEGNRRVCACKALLSALTLKSTDFLPVEIQKSFPTLDEVEDKELIDSLSNLDSVVYESRELAQSYIVDKHIEGVKKWESIEKSCYYYNRFQKTDNSFDTDRRISTIAKLISSDKKSEIKNCIIKYGFFIETYKAIDTINNKPDAVSEKISFLPLVDKFMPTLAGKDYLDLSLNSSLEYIIKTEVLKTYEDILNIVGEAFLVRPQEANAIKRAKDNLYRIHTDEVKDRKNQKKLIDEDVRIKGLKDLIQKYSSADDSAVSPVTTVSNSLNDDVTDPQSDIQEEAVEKNTTDAQNIIDEEKVINDTSNSQSSESVFEPSILWKPVVRQNLRLGFTQEEWNSFHLNADLTDGDAKIISIISELAKLSIANYPYSCALLFRTFLESVTIKAYKEKKPKDKSGLLVYQKGQLATEIVRIINSNKLALSEAEKGAIKQYINQYKLVETLNNYIHNPKLVDSSIIFNSWVTMKEYIKACLI
jgi:hypothetical protein